jgi:hypothetical protein
LHRARRILVAVRATVTAQGKRAMSGLAAKALFLEREISRDG